MLLLPLTIKVYKKLHYMVRSIFLFVVLFTIACQNEVALQHHQGYALGTTYHIQYAPFGEESEAIQDEIDSLFEVANQSMSTYIPNSIISRINRAEEDVVLDEHFLNVAKKATEVWEASQGFFDPTVGAWVNAYGFGPEKPLNSIDEQTRMELQKITGWERISISDRKLMKSHPEIYIDFNAIAKGYTVDLIATHLFSLGAKDVLVEIGGELRGKGKSPKSASFWRVGIDSPLQNEERNIHAVVALNNKALATSGNYRKYRIDSLTGEKFVHSINPLKGEPVRSNVLSASVLAEDCMSADAYATALMVMPFAQAKQMIEENKELEAFWILSDKKGELTEAYSSGWKRNN